MSYSIHQQIPMTVSGLKSKAKALARRNGLKLHKALDDAARGSGAHDYQHFRHLYGGDRAKIASFRQEIILEQNWGDPALGKTQRIGLRVPLSRPIEEFAFRGIGCLPRIQVRRRRGNRFLIEACNFSQESFAQSDLTRAARTIQFCDATGLIPATSRSVSSFRDPNYRSLDHSSAWMNPVSGKAIFVDEQYVNPRGYFGGTFEEDGQPWCNANDFVWRRPEWAGMYRPEDRTDFVLMSHRIHGEPLGPIVQRLEEYRPAILNWTGDFIC
jgi:hypothetical protein